LRKLLLFSQRATKVIVSGVQGTKISTQAHSRCR